MGRINIMFRNVVVLTLLLPLTAFFFCVYWSVTFNFKSATSTHCGVSQVFNKFVRLLFFIQPSCFLVLGMGHLESNANFNICIGLNVEIFPT